MNAQTRRQALADLLLTQESLPAMNPVAGSVTGYLVPTYVHAVIKLGKLCEDRAEAILRFLGMDPDEAMPQVAIIDVALHAFNIPEYRAMSLIPTEVASPEKVATKATVRSIGFLDLDVDDVSQILHLSLGDAERLVGGSLVLSNPGPSYKQALLLARLYVSIWGMVGGDEGPMRSWLRSVNKELDGNIPLQLMRSGHLEDVVTYVEGCAGKI